MERSSVNGALSPCFSQKEERIRLPVAIVLVTLWTIVAVPVHGQADTTAVAPADTTEAVPSDTSRSEPPEAEQDRPAEDPEVPSDPLSFPDPLYGRPAVDSLPALTPHAGLERVLAQQSGTFLYDLGAVGWPHGWSPRGLGTNRTGLWLEGHSYDSPLTGRARFDLLPPSFLERPGVGVDPGGAAVGVHTAWRDYDQLRPITEIRFRQSSNGLQAVEVSHSQKHRLSLFGTPGLFQFTFGFGGRETNGAFEGSDLQRERRIWGRLRYQRDEWAVELSDLSSRHRIGAHSGVVPDAGDPFRSILVLPNCEDCSVNPEARRNTFRNDLTARVRGPLVPGVSAPTTLSATWTSNTFDFQTGSPGDTTWTTKLNGVHGHVQQPLRVGRHNLTLDARGRLWSVARTDVSQIGDTRGEVHAVARDSVRFGSTNLALDAGWHVTSEQQYPSASIQLTRPLGPVRFTASATITGQRASLFETEGFESFVQPLPTGPSSLVGRVLKGRAGIEYAAGSLDLQVEGFAHQIRNAIDLFAVKPPAGERVASTDTVAARQTSTPVQRIGGTVSVGWRRDASSGLYATGQATALTTLNAGASDLHSRLARTLPTVHGRGRVGVRFRVFVDLVTDLYVQGRAWSSMNSRWFHPPTGRLVVPPATDPVPSRPGSVPGPSGTMDLRTDIKLMGATLFFALENVQASFAEPNSFEKEATLQDGTFTVPVFPLPARQFRFGIHWPIFD